MTIQKETNIVKLGLVDTAGQISYEKLRQHLYKDVDVFLVCYSVVNPVSYSNVIDKVSRNTFLSCIVVAMQPESKKLDSPANSCC